MRVVTRGCADYHYTVGVGRGQFMLHFVARHTSAFVEGLNNKIKVLKRRCYGLSNIAHLFQRLFLDLEGYRLFANHPQI
ncbi:MAG: transposase [Chloroflexi bacterium]|nr:transposase [Chloroflexota bacterium]